MTEIAVDQRGRERTSGSVRPVEGGADPAQGPTIDGRLDPQVYRTRPEDRRALTPAAATAAARLNRASRRSGRLSPLAYNITISHRHRFVWYRNAKVGTRTVLDYFERNHVPLDLHHASQVRLPTAAFAGYLRFGFVRDPVDRFVSAWSDKVVALNHFGFDDETRERMQDLDVFVAWVGEKDLAAGATDRHLILQTRAVDLSQVGFLGRLERFDADFAEICERLDLPTRPVVVRNRSQRSAVERPTLAESTRAAIRALYRLDGQVLGYP